MVTARTIAVKITLEVFDEQRATLTDADLVHIITATGYATPELDFPAWFWGDLARGELQRRRAGRNP